MKEKRGVFGRTLGKKAEQLAQHLLFVRGKCTSTDL
jgi:hypothetical protein